MGLATVERDYGFLNAPAYKNGSIITNTLDPILYLLIYYIFL